MAEPVDWGKVRELLDRASRAPEWPEHYEIARAFQELDALVGEMAEALQRFWDVVDLDGCPDDIIMAVETALARAKETRGG